MRLSLVPRVASSIAWNWSGERCKLARFLKIPQISPELGFGWGTVAFGARDWPFDDGELTGVWTVTIDMTGLLKNGSIR